MTYTIIDAKEFSDNFPVLCATDEKSMYLLAGDPTAGDFNYVFRVRDFSLETVLLLGLGFVFDELESSFKIYT